MRAQKGQYAWMATVGEKGQIVIPKVLKDQIKEVSKKQFRPGDKEVVVHGSSFDWVTSRTTTLKIDEAMMEADGVLDKYKVKKAETIKLIPKKRKE